MKKTLLIMLAAILLAGCGNPKTCEEYCQQKEFNTGSCITCSGLINAENPIECDSNNFFKDKRERKICLGDNWQVEDTAAHGCFCE